MVDTPRTRSDLLTTLFQDGQAAGISANDIRDLIVSMVNVLDKGAADGVASLDAAARLPNAQNTASPVFTGTTVSGKASVQGTQTLGLATPILLGPGDGTDAAGWRDLIAGFTVKGSGSNDPAWTNFRNGVWLYAFPATVMKEVWVNYHIDHDYSMGSVAYPHVHWTPNTTSTGTVRWGIEYTVAKGHQQATGSDFGASTTVYVEQTVSANAQYRHHIAEVSTGNAIPATLLEPDTLILMRIFRDAAHANDTFPDQVFGIQADLHYRAERFATRNKAPNFYA